MAKDVYQAVTDRILALLDQGVAPWRQPIQRRAGEDGFPKSLATGKRYRGINVFLLAMTSWALRYDSTYWVTFNQAKKLGGQVRKGEKSSLVIFWKMLEKKDAEAGEATEIPMIRHYNVFNADQCDGIDPPDAAPVDENAPAFEPIAECERIAAQYPRPPTIEQGGATAFYQPRTDTVRIAKPERFETAESYYAVLFHELCHSTGHSSRLNRGFEEEPAAFGSPDYSREELVAELGSAFLAATSGISPPTIEQSAAYLDGWAKKLQGDKKLIVYAAAAAQRAADHILGVTFE